MSNESKRVCFVAIEVVVDGLKVSFSELAWFSPPASGDGFSFAFGETVPFSDIVPFVVESCQA